MSLPLTMKTAPIFTHNSLLRSKYYETVHDRLKAVFDMAEIRDREKMQINDPSFTVIKLHPGLYVCNYSEPYSEKEVYGLRELNIRIENKGEKDEKHYMQYDDVSYDKDFESALREAEESLSITGSKAPAPYEASIVAATSKSRLK